MPTATRRSSRLASAGPSGPPARAAKSPARQAKSPARGPSVAPSAPAPAKRAGAPAPPARFLFSPATDLIAFGLPLLAAVVLLPTLALLDADDVPRWAHFTLVVCTDVAHVWGTAFRTYLDREALTRRWRLLVAAPPASFALSFLIHRLAGPSVFWTLLAYYAMYHFAKQAHAAARAHRPRTPPSNIDARRMRPFGRLIAAAAPPRTSDCSCCTSAARADRAARRFNVRRQPST